MCGIVGGVAPRAIRSYLLDGLKTIEYRGYDSAGVAFFDADKISVYRAVGRVKDLEMRVDSQLSSKVGIGHTRWATHGRPAEINAHPHRSNRGYFTIIHNGVIENFRLLKNSLILKNYQFYSETDTEVIANLLEDNYLLLHDAREAIAATLQVLHGSYALAILFSEANSTVYFAKNRSPLIIGHSDNGNYLASDYLPMLKVANQFITIEDQQYGYLTQTDIHLYQLGSEAEIPLSYHQTEIVAEDIELIGYPHYMLKEIEEAPACVRRLLDNYYDGEHFLFSPAVISALSQAQRVVILACGTSYHASLVGANFLRQSGKIVDVFIASEWAYYPDLNGTQTLYLAVSQSGETADLIRCVDLIISAGRRLITITNTLGSTLARKANHTLLLYAGVEIAVASTKAYIAQVTLFALLYAALTARPKMINDLEQVIQAQSEIVKNKAAIRIIAEEIFNTHDAYFLGRGLDYYTALESSLKLKEITYIHSEAFPGGELKHGPIALIEKATPVIGFISDSRTAEALRSNYHEVAARGANVISVSSASLSNGEDRFITRDCPQALSPLVKVIFSQYLAYYVALRRNLNIDKPRNLAKSVTVE